MHEALRHIFGGSHLTREQFAGQKFFQQHRNLQFRQPGAHAAVDAKAERQVAAGICTCDIKGFCAREHALIAVATDVPDDDLVALLHRNPGDIGIFHRRAPHVRQRRLPTQDFRNCIGNQTVVGL